MPLWPASNEGSSAPAPHTGNKRLDKQLRASRERELREVPFPTVITPVLAVRARSLMLDSCDGRAPRMPSDSDSERERDDFLNNYFTQEKIDELPVISPGAEDGSVWKHLQVTMDITSGPISGPRAHEFSATFFGALWCRFWAALPR
jgi:hypothetical protein